MAKKSKKKEDETKKVVANCDHPEEVIAKCDNPNVGKRLPLPKT